jgi:outer membrane lipoprotein LolB
VSAGRWATPVALMLLSACALQRPETSSSAGAATIAGVDWAARRGDLLSIKDWDARGRLAVRSPHGGAQGDLQWEQRGDETRLRVNGPFGAGAYEIRWTSQELTVVGKDRELSRSYAGPEAMNAFLAEQLGWPFPASSVRFWLLGVPDPAAAAAQERFDAHGALASIEQAGWSIAYERFAKSGTEWLPTRVTIAGEQARIRLAVDEWQLH